MKHNNMARKLWLGLMATVLLLGSIPATAEVSASAGNDETYWLDEVGSAVILEDPAYFKEDEAAETPSEETNTEQEDTSEASTDDPTDTQTDMPTDMPTDAPSDTPTDSPTVPDDASDQTEEPTVDLEALFGVSIKVPAGWRNTSSASVRIKIKPKSEKLWHMVRYRLDSGDWIGISQSAFIQYEDHFYTDIEVMDNAKMVVRLFGDEENRFDTAKDICIFDRKAPNVTAGFRELILHVEAADELSGVAGIQVNSLLFTTLVDGKLDICMDESLTVYKQLAIHAYDYAGNFSEPVTLDNPYYIAPTPKPTATPKPTSKPTAKPTKKPSHSSGTADTPTAAATPVVTEAPASTEPAIQMQQYPYLPTDLSMLGYTQPVQAAAPETVYVPLGPGQPYTGEGNMQTRDMLYSASTNKQFISVQSRAGETYYLVIDYDKPIDADNDIYETYFLNLVDDRDLMNVVSEDELLPTPTPQIVYVTPEPVRDSQPTPIVVEDDASESKGSPLLLVIGLAAIGGAVFWWMKSRKNKAAITPDFDEYEFEEDSDKN